MKHDAEAMGDVMLKFLEDKPREVAIDALAMTLMTYLHPNDEEFFGCQVMERGRLYYAATKH